MGIYCILVGILMIFGVKDIILMKKKERMLGEAVSVSSTPNLRRENKNVERGSLK